MAETLVVITADFEAGGKAYEPAAAAIWIDEADAAAAIAAGKAVRPIDLTALEGRIATEEAASTSLASRLTVEEAATATATAALAALDLSRTYSTSRSYSTPAAAVAAAYASGEALFWPAGAHAASASIANFWDVPHVGPGTVTRGGQTLYISPTEAQTNTLYVNPTTGVDTNDGITSDAAFGTIQKAIDIVDRYGLLGRWTISLAAGTYEPFDLPDQMRVNYRLDILGPTLTQSAGEKIVLRIPNASGSWAVGNTLSASPSGATGTVTDVTANRLEVSITSGAFAIGDVLTGSAGGAGTVGTFALVPTSILDCDGADTGVTVSGESRVVIRRLKVINAPTGTAFECSSGRMTLIDCHTRNCQKQVVAITLSTLTVNGGDFDGRDDAGVVIPGSQGWNALYNTSHAVEGGSYQTAPCFHHVERGGMSDELSVGHLDYSMYHDCTDVGLELTRTVGQSNTKLVQIHRCPVGLRGNNTSVYINGIDFGLGTSDACDVPVQMIGGSTEYAASNSAGSKVPQSLGYSTVATNTTDEVFEIWSGPEIEGWFPRIGGGHRATLIINCTLTGSCLVRLKCEVDGVTSAVCSVTLPSTVTEVEIDMLAGWPSSLGSLRGSLTAKPEGGAIIIGRGALASTFAGVTSRLFIEIDRATASDSVALYLAEASTNLI